MTDEIRVNDCLYGYCPRRSKECERCDAVKAALAKEAQLRAALYAPATTDGEPK